MFRRNSNVYKNFEEEDGERNAFDFIDAFVEKLKPVLTSF